MKTLITASGNSSDSLFDKRFGRAPWFCVYEEEKGRFEFVENKSAKLENDAGVNAVKEISFLKIQKIISGDFGSKTEKLLKAQNIQMVILKDNKSIQQIIDLIK